MEANSGVRGRDRAAVQKALEGDERQTDTQSVHDLGLL